MCEIDMEPCDVWVPSIHRARKEHRCDCCGTAIRPGQRYHRLFTIFEGDAATSKHCRRCNSALLAFGKAHDGMTPTPVGFDDILDECIAERDEGYQIWMRVRAAIRRRRAQGGPRDAA